MAKHISVKFTPFESSNDLLRKKITDLEERQERVQGEIAQKKNELESLIPQYQNSSDHQTLSKTILEPSSPEQQSYGMQAYVTEVYEEDEDEKVTLTIESTNIRNNNQELSYKFKVFVLPRVPSFKSRQIYISQKTILDRPCWRDDTVTLYTTNQGHKIEVYSFADDENCLTLVDTLELQPMTTVKKAFVKTNEKTM